MPTYPTAPITTSPTKPKIDQNEGPQEEMVLNVPKRPKNWKMDSVGAKRVPQQVTLVTLVNAGYAG